MFNMAGEIHKYFRCHDKTASAISWIQYSLAENPEGQRKCQAEIDELLGDRESDDLECLSRETTHDIDLGDRVAPTRTVFIMNIWMYNHMENIWGPDHMEFKPEIFSEEKIEKMEHFQYVPFSAGPRNCIGQNFALNEENVVLSKLLRNFTFRLDPTHEVERNLSVVMRTKDGMFMFAEKRKV